MVHHTTVNEGDVPEQTRLHEATKGEIENPWKNYEAKNHIHVNADCAPTAVEDEGFDILGLQAKMMESLGFVDIRDDEFIVEEDSNTASGRNVQHSSTNMSHAEATEHHSLMYSGVSLPFIPASLGGPLPEEIKEKKPLQGEEAFAPYLQGSGFRFYPSSIMLPAGAPPPCGEVSMHEGHSRRTERDRPFSKMTTFVPNQRDMEDVAEMKARVEAGLAVYQREWPPLQGCPRVYNHLAPVEDDHGAEECLVGINGKYQPYCSQIITPRLNQAAYATLVELKRLQQMTESTLVNPAMCKETGEMKPPAPKRYYCSLKEVSKVIRFCKLIIIAPDVRPSSTSNVKPVRLLMSVIEEATKEGTPYIFALSRKGIGRVFGKDKNMSIMAIMSLEGVEKECQIMIEEAKHGREIYRQSRSSSQGTSVP